MTHPGNTDRHKVIPRFHIILTMVPPQLCTDSNTAPSADSRDLRAGEKESIITSDCGKGESAIMPLISNTPLPQLHQSWPTPITRSHLLWRPIPLIRG